MSQIPLIIHETYQIKQGSISLDAKLNSIRKFQDTLLANFTIKTEEYSRTISTMLKKNGAINVQIQGKRYVRFALTNRTLKRFGLENYIINSI